MTSTNSSSGVGVIDKAALVLSALEQDPRPLRNSCHSPDWASDGPPCPGCSRAAQDRFVNRDLQGRLSWARAAELSLLAGERIAPRRAAGPVLAHLRDRTGESWRSSSGGRAICVCAWPLRNGPWACATPCRWATLSMRAGSAAQVPPRRSLTACTRDCARRASPPRCCRASAVAAGQSIAAERERGVASDTRTCPRPRYPRGRQRCR